MTSPSHPTPAKASEQWDVIHVAGYWRLRRNWYLVATFNTKGAALAGMAVEKRRAKGQP